MTICAPCPHPPRSQGSGVKALWIWAHGTTGLSGLSSQTTFRSIEVQRRHRPAASELHHSLSLTRLWMWALVWGSELDFNFWKALTLFAASMHVCYKRNYTVCVWIFKVLWRKAMTLWKLFNVWLKTIDFGAWNPTTSIPGLLKQRRRNCSLWAVKPKVVTKNISSSYGTDCLFS